MPCMYFSGTDSDIITFDDPENQCIRVNLDLFIRVLKNNEQNTRVFLDTHLLKIRGNENGQEPPTEKLVPKSNASVDLGNMPSMPILVYTSRTLISAEFREIDSDEFKKTYLAPLDRDVRESNIRSRPLAQEYRYPFGDASRVEHDIQVSFNEEIAGTIKRLYRDVGDRQNYFGSESIIRPPLNQRKIVQPDIIHMITNSDLGIQYPEIVFGIGDYKTGIYKMTQGFEEFKIALSNRRRLSSHSIGNFFADREWSPRDSYFDHQSISGFFKYEIVDGEMIVDYYVINNPETVENGITLRSAIAGSFYNNVIDAANTKARLMNSFCVASNTDIKKIEESDPFFNVRPRDASGSSGKLTRRGFSGNLDFIRENDVSDGFDAIDGNTYCRVIYDSAKVYPDLKLISPVFVKLYYYSSRLWEENSLMCLEIPEKKG